MLIQLVLGFSTLEIGLILLASFASDIGGFYAGCNFGKHKIWPGVSPKKTWEGSAGGMLLCIAVCLGIGCTFGLSMPMPKATVATTTCTSSVITSYSIHYTKLYDSPRAGIRWRPCYGLNPTRPRPAPHCAVRFPPCAVPCQQIWLISGARSSPCNRAVIFGAT